MRGSIARMQRSINVEDAKDAPDARKAEFF
jgi:hypothetical protein